MSKFYFFTLFAWCTTVGIAATADAPPGLQSASAVSPGPAKLLSSGLMPGVDPSALMTPAAGVSTETLSATNESPAQGDAAFRTVCTPSHMNFDDPIVFPGREGVSHLHLFFGNTLARADSTAESIAEKGSSTCRGGIANRSSYWVPAMIDTRTGAPVTPLLAHFYYKTGGIRDVRKIKPFPTGLRMIAGDAKNARPSNSGPLFSCEGPQKRMAGTGVQVDCPVGSEMFQNVIFPQCWDGVNLDSPDHKSHMAYAWGGSCPASHPVAGPEISQNIVYPITKAGEARYWRLSSDNYSGGPGGYSNHGDWFNGWKPDVMKAFVEGCLNKGLDCHSHLLGDGRQID